VRKHTWDFEPCETLGTVEVKKKRKGLKVVTANKILRSKCGEEKNQRGWDKVRSCLRGKTNTSKLTNEGVLPRKKKTQKGTGEGGSRP